MSASPSISYLVQPTTATTATTVSRVVSTALSSVTASASGPVANVAGTPSSSAVSSAAASASASAAPAPQVLGSLVSQVRSFPFLYHINILILVLFALFVLSTLPRTFGRVMHTRFDGAALRSGGGDASVPPRPRPAEDPMAAPAPMIVDDDADTRTLNGSNPFDDGSSVAASNAPLVVGPPGGAGMPTGNAPMRVRGFLSLTHPMFVMIANYRVLPGLELRKLAVLAVYFGIWLYAGLYRNNPFVNPYRATVLASSQIPLVVACVMKNNLIQFLTGTAYEKLNYIHRFAGRLVIVAINVHAIVWFFRWNQTPGRITMEFREDLVRWGTVGLVSADLLFVGSLPIVRARSYTFFLTTHILGFFWLVVAMYIHYPQTLPYFVTAFVFYGFDQLLRAARTRVTTAYITAQPKLNGGSTQVVMPGLAAGWRAGQHVRMRLVSPDYPRWFGLPLAALLARVRAHPFSISTRPGGAGLELIVKKVGASTAELYRLAGGEEKAMGEKPGMGGDAEMAREQRQVQVVVEGPYSGPTVLFEAYSGVVLVAGGSGITYVLSLLDDLLAKHAAGASRVRVLEIVWSVSDYASLVALLPTLRPLLRPRASPHGALALRMRVHYTRASRAGAPPPPPPASLPPGLVLLSGRPNYARVVAETCDAVVDAHAMARGGAPSGVGVTHCGPGELGAQIHGAVGKLSWRQWMDVRGVEVHSESFGY